jgi:hypothetical protein
VVKIQEGAVPGKSTHVQMDLTPKKGQYDSLITRICKIAEVAQERVKAVKASPPCETFTLADASNISRRNHHRDHSDRNKPPRSEASCVTRKDWMRRRKAIKHDNMVKQLVRSFLRDRKNGAMYDLFMENPLGSLRQRPYMRGEAVEEELKRITVNYCAFGAEYAKATDFWTTLAWEPKGSTGNGKCCGGKCGQGVRKSNGRFLHTKVIAGASDRSVKGPHRLKQLWKSPEKLTPEVVELLGPPKDGRDVIIDLYSGGRSWEKAVIAKGYHYISVDITAMETA